MPKFPEDPAFVAQICEDIAQRLQALTCLDWKVTPCPLPHGTHVVPPAPGERTVLVSEVAIRRLLVRKFYRPLCIDRILLSRSGLVSDVAIKVIQSSVNSPVDGDTPSTEKMYQCPRCEAQFAMSGTKWIIKQCPICDQWLARGAYTRIS